MRTRRDPVRELRGVRRDTDRVVGARDREQQRCRVGYERERGLELDARRDGQHVVVGPELDKLAAAGNTASDRFRRAARRPQSQPQLERRRHEALVIDAA